MEVEVSVSERDEPDTNPDEVATNRNNQAAVSFSNPTRSGDPRQRSLCQYAFYSYFFPSDVDAALLPFVKHLAQQQDEDELRGDLNEASAYPIEIRQDRRVKAVEAKTGCTIEMASLDGNLIRGLPMRKVTVTGASFDKIATALTLLQDLLPDLMENAVFIAPLPSTTKNWCVPGKFVIRPIVKGKIHTRAVQCNTKLLGWEKRIQRGRIFPFPGYNHRPN